MLRICCGHSPPVDNVESGGLVERSGMDGVCSHNPSSLRVRPPIRKRVFCPTSRHLLVVDSIRWGMHSQIPYPFGPALGGTCAFSPA